MFSETLLVKATKLVQFCDANFITITTAESCTGGLVSALITSIPGSSNVFHQGYVTYCDSAKKDILGVAGETLKNFSAVSHETAVEMAQGAIREANAKFSVSLTGYAGGLGPESERCPHDGTVFIGVAHRKSFLDSGRTKVINNMIVRGTDNTKCLDIYCNSGEDEFKFDGDRNEVRMQATEKAIDLLLKYVQQIYNK